MFWLEKPTFANPALNIYIFSHVFENLKQTFIKGKNCLLSKLLTWFSVSQSLKLYNCKQMFTSEIIIKHVQSSSILKAAFEVSTQNQTAIEQ